MKGIEIARKLNISTSALRHYEAWGLIPEVERAENGYRKYTKVHEVYFRCIRALIAGCGMDFVREVMPLVKEGKKLDVLWKMNRAQVELHLEKETVQKTVDILDLKELSNIPKYRNKNSFTIGEVAEEANVSTSAIRHWEREGLVQPERHQESGFRIYNSSDIRKVLIIRTVQRVAYSLDIVREILQELDKHNITQAKEMALQSLHYLDYRLKEQVRGIAYLHELFEMVSTSEESEGLS